MHQHQFIYCPRCGHKLIEKHIGDEGLMPYCNTCQKAVFDMFFVTINTMVINELGEVCLLKQNYISDVYWGFVSGYVKYKDNLEETVDREVYEETGLIINDKSYVLSYFHEPMNSMRAGFVAFVKKAPFVPSVNEVDDIKWVAFDEAEKLLKPDGFGMQIYQRYKQNLR